MCSKAKRASAALPALHTLLHAPAAAPEPDSPVAEASASLRAYRVRASGLVAQTDQSGICSPATWIYSPTVSAFCTLTVLRRKLLVLKSYTWAYSPITPNAQASSIDESPRICDQLCHGSNSDAHGKMRARPKRHPHAGIGGPMWPKRGFFNQVVRGRKWLLVAGILALATVASAAIIPNLFPFLDPTGLISTYNANGPIDEGTTNVFFQSLGTNGRSCGTCHLASDGFGLGVASVRAKFDATHGNDPLFASIDGANCPDGTSIDRASHSLLLRSGLIRVFLPVPANAQYQIQAERDPYGCAVVTDESTGVQTVSVYRRPLPTTNLRFLSAVMFDGRETIQPLTAAATFQQNLQTDLMHQAIDATLTHAQATEPPTLEQQTAIVNFELGLNSAQALDFRAGWLNFAGALGGPANLSNQSYYPGTNDSLGADPEGNAFNSTAFTIFAAWENSPDPMRRKRSEE